MRRRTFEIHVLPRQLRTAGWKQLLEHWASLIDYATDTDEDGDDVPYWYGERTLTGLLAAAAWKCRRGWALEEFTGLRGKRLKTKSGRGDLWLGLGKHGYTIEAKVKWPQSDADYAVEYAKNALRAATKQLWKLNSEYRLGPLIAICYLVPCPKKGSSYDRPDRLNDIITAVNHKFGSNRSIVATYIPNYQPPVYGGQVFPGVILIGKVVSWNGPGRT